MDYPLISADSHITEAPDTYTAHIDRAWRDKAPRIVSTEHEGDVFQIDGMARPIQLGLVAAAGKPPEQITRAGVKFSELHRGGWDPDARMDDQATSITKPLALRLTTAGSPVFAPSIRPGCWAVASRQADHRRR